MKMISIDDLIKYCDIERAAYKANNCGNACTALHRVAEFAKENAVEGEPVKQEIIELLNECRETIFGATYTSGEEYTHAITLCDKISAVIGEGKQ